MPVMNSSILRALAALLVFPLLTGCARWFTQAPTEIRHTRMMVHSDQTYFGGPLQ
jgi:hypothetical protein